jgi:Rrf2 family protein
MIDLVIHAGDRPVLIQAIAERQEISRKYLDNLLAALKSAGLVRSVRGARGGYMLAKPPERITVKDIVVALDGEPTLADCLEDTLSCPRQVTCPTRDLWEEMTTSLHHLLKKTTLKDMARKAKDKEQHKGLMYHI